MKFQWDVNKAHKVLTERGIDFRDAAIALVECPVLVWPSPKHGEDRDVGLVEIQNKVWAIVYLQRHKAFRIITIRRARQKEERAYREFLARRFEIQAERD